MSHLREDYDLPDRTPVAYRMWVLVGIIPVIAIVLWVVLPNSPWIVALLVIVILASVFAGVQGIIRSRALREVPGRRPMTPPSTQPKG